MERLHILVTGRVQGVYYRATTHEVARRLGLAGWVRNLPDGRVEAVAEGPRPALDEFLAWCQEGPPAARVDHVAADWQGATGGFTAFDVRR